jgi:hypothetical protein
VSLFGRRIHSFRCCIDAEGIRSFFTTHPRPGKRAGNRALRSRATRIEGHARARYPPDLSSAHPARCGPRAALWCQQTRSARSWYAGSMKWSPTWPLIPSTSAPGRASLHVCLRPHSRAFPLAVASGRALVLSLPGWFPAASRSIAGETDISEASCPLDEEGGSRSRLAPRSLVGRRAIAPIVLVHP